MGRVVSFEMSSQNPEKAKQFYSEVFGWEMAEPNWGYSSVRTGNDGTYGIDGGITEGPSDHPHGIRVQIEVESIDNTISAAKDNGAQVVREKMDFGEFYLAYLVDPVGLGFGLIEKK